MKASIMILAGATAVSAAPFFCCGGFEEEEPAAPPPPPPAPAAPASPPPPPVKEYVFKQENCEMFDWNVLREMIPDYSEINRNMQNVRPLSTPPTPDYGLEVGNSIWLDLTEKPYVRRSTEETYIITYSAAPDLADKLAETRANIVAFCGSLDTPCPVGASDPDIFAPLREACKHGQN
ncbi:uncharacterized protein BROUX77_003312 [Berkeleyomyces rouxiae]|uniref:uncharacterized protein n=1 Tax=Berkeleyomyces rouxiae TaxID=2035830 RepID=UPI003B7DC17B